MSKQEWGNATWFLFHGLVTKLKPEYDSEYKVLLKHFITICSHLPCPDCQSHAIHTNNTATLKMIRSNNNLKDYFWRFHNRVNQRLNKKQFSMEQHDLMYNTCNVRLLVGPFRDAMNAKQPFSLMMQSLHRKRVVDDFISYIQNNFYKFN